MGTYRYDSLDELVDAYAADLDADHDEQWWRDARYAAQTESGEVRLSPEPSAENGATASSWRISVSHEGVETERRISDDTRPTADDAERELTALMRQLRPRTRDEAEQVVRQLRDLARARRDLDSEARSVALDAVARGVKKVAVANAARISRVTLDRWIRDE